MLHPTPHDRGGGSPIVRFVDVHAGYSTTPVLEDIDLTVMPGDFVGILGPSGSGKTTLLRTILGATRLLQGEVTVRGVSTAKDTLRAPATCHSWRPSTGLFQCQWKRSS